MIIILWVRCRYHEASENANARVLELLRELSAKLQTKINVLVFASMLLVIAKALFSHAWYVCVFNLFPLRTVHLSSFNVSTAAVKGEDESGFFQLLLVSVQMR